MRANLDATTEALYLAGSYDVHARIEVENGSSTFVPLEGYYTSVVVRLPDPDEPIGSMSLELIRDLTKSGMDDSLSPLVAASDFNKLDDMSTYSPLLQLGREVTLEVILTTKFAARPGDADVRWYEIFRGIITKVDWPDRDRRKVVVDINGLAAVLEHAKSEAAYIYTQGDSLETVVDDILTNNGFGSVPVYFPSATGKVLPNDYAPGLQKTVWAQLKAVAESMGWVVYYRYRGTNPVELTFFEPARTKVTPDMSVAVDDFQRISVDESEVRNVGYLVYVDTAGSEQLLGPEVDIPSINKYGGFRRPFWIKLDEFSPIRSSTTGTEMLQAALSDVADPDVVAVGSSVPLVFAESGVDLYTITRIGDTFFDSDQTWGLFGATVEFRVNQEVRSSISVRGAPTAGGSTWKNLAYETNYVPPSDTPSVIVDDRFVSLGAQPGEPVPTQGWYRRLRIQVGSADESFTVDYDFDRPTIGGGSTNLARSYVIDATPGEIIQVILEDGASNPQVFFARSDAGNTVFDSAFAVTFTPNSADAAAGTDGDPITSDILSLADEDDLGFRVDGEVEATLLEYPDANRDAQVDFNASTVYFIAQEIEVPAGPDVALSGITMYLAKTGTPAGAVWLELRADNSGAPGAPIIASSVIQVSTITGSFLPYKFRGFFREILSGGGTYWIAVYQAGSSPGNYVSVGDDASASVVTGFGNKATADENGTSWTVTPGPLAGVLVEAWASQSVPARSLAPAADGSVQFSWLPDGTVALSANVEGDGTPVLEQNDRVFLVIGDEFVSVDEKWAGYHVAYAAERVLTFLTSPGFRSVRIQYSWRFTYGYDDGAYNGTPSAYPGVIDDFYFEYDVDYFYPLEPGITRHALGDRNIASPYAYFKNVFFAFYDDGIPKYDGMVFTVTVTPYTLPDGQGTPGEPVVLEALDITQYDNAGIRVARQRGIYKEKHDEAYGNAPLAWIDLDDAVKGAGLVHTAATGASYVCVGMSFWIRKVGTPTGFMRFRIYNSSSGLPGTLRATAVLNVEKGLGSGDWMRKLVFGKNNDFTLVNGNDYILTVEYPNGDASNYIRVGADSSGGSPIQFDGDSWSATGAQDIWFRLYERDAAEIDAVSEFAARSFEIGTGLQYYRDPDLSLYEGRMMLDTVQKVGELENPFTDVAIMRAGRSKLTLTPGALTLENAVLAESVQPDDYTGSAAVTIDWSNGPIATIQNSTADTVPTSVDVNVAGMAEGVRHKILFVYGTGGGDGSGITWTGMDQWDGGVKPTLGQGAVGDITMVEIDYIGGVTLGRATVYS